MRRSENEKSSKDQFIAELQELVQKHPQHAGQIQNLIQQVQAGTKIDMRSALAKFSR